jgi:hypothetical protein
MGPTPPLNPAPPTAKIRPLCPSVPAKAARAKFMSAILCARHTVETQLKPELQAEFAQQACPPLPQLVVAEVIWAHRPCHCQPPVLAT